MIDDVQEPNYNSNRIKDLLGINKSTEEIKSNLEKLLEARPSLFGKDEPCSEIPLEPFPDKYFVAQEFNENKNDLRETLAISFKDFGFSPITAEDFMWTEKLICKISALILGTPFGIYQLSSSQNRNVYLELGIAMGLSKPFVLIKDKEAIPATIIRDIEYYQINDYLSARHELGNLLKKYITSIGQYRPKEFDHASENLGQNVVISHWDLDSVDISITLAKQIKSSGYTPIIIGKRDQKIEGFLISEVGIKSPKFAETRDEIFKAIAISKFGVFRIDKITDPNNFLALGMSIGLNKRFLPIKNARNEVPTDLNYLSPLEYRGYTDLEKILSMRFEDWLNKLER